MKRTVLITVLLLVGVALAIPQPSFSWGGPVAVVAGAALVGAVIGSQAYNYYGPPVAYGYPLPPAYAYPAPAYVYPAPVYAYPYYGPRYYPGYKYYGHYRGRGHYARRW